jgi:hypothetical protein
MDPRGARPRALALIGGDAKRAAGETVATL